MARIGYGAAFKVGDGATPTEVFTAISEVYEVVPPAPSAGVVDVTHHGSPNGHQEFIPGLIDGGEVEIQLNYSNAAYVILLAKFNARAVTNYQAVGPNGAIWAFAGFPTTIPTEMPIDDKMVISTTFKVSGKPTYTPGS